MRRAKNGRTVVAVLGHVAILAVLLFGAGVPASGNDQLEYELLRTAPNQFERTTIRLYIRPLTADLSISARCHVCQNGQDLGRFPLQRLDQEKGQVPSVEDDGRLLFRIECLAEQFCDESYISISLHDEPTGKPAGGMRIQLREAIVKNQK